VNEARSALEQPRVPATAVLLIDDHRVRVTQWRFTPGANTGWHRHAHDYVVVPLMTGQLMLDEPEGPRTVQLIAGGAYARKAGVEHDVINANDHDFTFVEVELK
jgi:quercetin dioxygenase-like cupin family protein